MLEPNGRNWAFALDMPRQWTGDNSLRMGSDYQLGTFFGGPRVRRLDYRVTSYVDYSAREPLTDGRAGGVSSLAARKAARARALWPRAGSPMNRAAQHIIERAMAYLRSQPFEYTLTPPAARRATRRRVPVRDARGFLRALRVGADGIAARRGSAGARGHGLSRRRAQRDRRLLHRAPVRRACLDRSLARRRRLGARRRRRGGRTGTRGARLRSLSALAAVRRSPRPCARAGGARSRCFGTPSKRAGSRGSSATGPTSSVRCSSRSASRAYAARSAPPCCSGSP